MFIDLEEYYKLIDDLIKKYGPKRDELDPLKRRILDSATIQKDSIISYEKGDYQAALEHNLKASRLLNPEEDDSWGISFSLLGLRGDIFLNMNEPEEALNCAFAAYGLAIMDQNPDSLELILHQICKYYSKVSPDKFMRPPLPLYQDPQQKIGEDNQIAYSMLFKAQCFIEAGLNDFLLDGYFSKALNTFQENKFSEGIGDVFRTIGYRNAKFHYPDINISPQNYVLYAVEEYKKSNLDRKLIFCKELLENIKNLDNYAYSLRFSRYMMQN